MGLSSGVTIKAMGKTDLGRVRSSNQDSYLIDTDNQLYIVADGMGGHAGGEIASHLCVQEISRSLSKLSKITQSGKHPDPVIFNELVHSVNLASSKIYERALEDPKLKGMGTTATVLKIVGDHAYLAHVGDSRLYLIRAGFIYQLTYDHSFVSEQVRAGLLTEEEAELHQLKNIITRSVGYQEEEEVDTDCLQLEEGDMFIICSDGLHGKVTDLDISQISQKYKLAAVNHLIDLANERGGNDNITVILVHA